MATSQNKDPNLRNKDLGIHPKRKTKVNSRLMKSNQKASHWYKSLKYRH